MSEHAPAVASRAGPDAVVERRRLRAGQILGPLMGLIGVSALFALLEPESFLSVYNFQTIAAQTVIVGFGAIGMTFVVVAGGIDLSLGSTIALASVVTALGLKHGWSPLEAMAAGVATGSLIGLLNGALITRLRVVPFIVTLGTMGIGRGLAKYLADEQKIDAPAHWLASIMAKTPTPSWLLVAPGTDPTTAVGKELDVIAAVVIDGASLSGGTGGIGGSLMGAFLMSVLANGCTLTGVPNYVQEILIGVIIIVAVALDRLRHRKATE